MKRVRLVAARRGKGWSQEQIAERLEVTRNTYSLWELGKKTPYPVYIARLCTLLEKEPYELDLAEEMEEMDASRRQMLAGGLGLLALPMGIGPMVALEEFLPQASGALNACWRLMGGKDIALASSLVDSYVPTLSRLTFSPSAYQETAAGLATQAKILQAVLAMHKMNIIGREMYSLEAVQAAQFSGDSGLLAAARMTVGYTYTYCVPRPQKAIDAYLGALHALGDERSLLRSDIYMGLADAYAQHRQEQEALEAIGLAKDYFPEHPELDPRFLYADVQFAELYQWEGKMYLDLAHQYPGGYYQSAYDAFAASASLNAVAERSQAETLISYAEAAMGLEDLEHYAECLRSGAMLALKIGSQKRYSEALTIFHKTPIQWQKEAPIQSLADEIFHPHHQVQRSIAQ